MGKVYDEVFIFKRKYPGTLAWRLKKHSKVIENYIDVDEEIKYAFCGQKGQLFNTVVLVLTNKRLLIGKSNILFGSSYTQVTPDMYNDLEIYSGLMFGSITIDTIKEEIQLSYLSKKSLDDIENNVASFMMAEKKKFKHSEE